MRICVVTPYDLSYDGGVNRHVFALAHALRRGGDRVRVLGPASGAVPAACFGLRGVVNIAANGSVGRVGMLVPGQAVRRFLRAGRFDVIHVHEPWLPGIAQHAVRAGAAPVLGTFHCYSDTPHLLVRMARRALARRVRHLRSAIAVSPAAAEFARSVYRGPIHLVPNGVDTGCFSYAGTPAGLDTSPLRLLFVGRYDEPRKGVVHLLEAVALLRARGLPVELRIVGGGGAVPDTVLTRAANAIFLGRLSDAALVDEYRQAAIFCAPSTHGESFGLVLVEAMACGCPVVASDIRGYRDAAAGAALLVPPADPESLANAISRIADDHALRRQLVARGHWRARALSWERLVHGVRDHYLSLTPEAPQLVLGASA